MSSVVRSWPLGLAWRKLGVLSLPPIVSAAGPFPTKTVRLPLKPPRWWCPFRVLTHFIRHVEVSSRDSLDQLHRLLGAPDVNRSNWACEDSLLNGANQPTLPTPLQFLDAA